MNLTENKTPLSILVIDDEAQIQRLLTVALDSNGYRVYTSSDGRQGIAAAAQRRHDAIILDLGLPDINGVEVLKNLRGWTQTPVIVLTVQDGEYEKVEALDSGAADLTELFGGIALSITEATHPEVVAFLQNACGAHIRRHRVGEDIIGRARRSAVELALEREDLGPEFRAILADICRRENIC